MNEKHPIKFSLGQFILFLSMGLVILGFSFLLGARFGGHIFPNFYAKQFEKNRPFNGLEPERTSKAEGASAKKSRLVDTLEEEEDEEGPDAQAPRYQVGSDGAAELLDEEEEEEGNRGELLMENKTLLQRPIDRQTMVRFKSSGYSRFSVEVGNYFDELIASKKIADLKEKGYEAYLVILNPKSNSPSYSVRVGAFGDRALAEDFATNMSNKQGMELRVVRMD